MCHGTWLSATKKCMSRYLTLFSSKFISLTYDNPKLHFLKIFLIYLKALLSDFTTKPDLLFGVFGHAKIFQNPVQKGRRIDAINDSFVFDISHVKSQHNKNINVTQFTCSVRPLKMTFFQNFHFGRPDQAKSAGKTKSILSQKLSLVHYTNLYSVQNNLYPNVIFSVRD